MFCLVDYLLETVKIPDAILWGSAGVSASTLIHHVAYVDNDAHHFHWRLRFPRFLCRRQVPSSLGSLSSQDLLSIKATCQDYVARDGIMLPLCSMLKVSSRRRGSELSCASSVSSVSSTTGCRALLRSQCRLPASDGAAQGKSPHELGCPPLPGQWCKPCFQWRQYLAPPYSQMVHLDITSQYLVEKHKCWPFSIDGTVARAYSFVEGMVSRWMDANGFNWRFHLIWRWLLLVAPNHDHMVSDHHIPVESCAGWTSSRNQIARSLLKSGQKPL